MGRQLELLLLGFGPAAAPIILLVSALCYDLLLAVAGQALPVLHPLLKQLVKGGVANDTRSGIPDVLGNL